MGNIYETPYILEIVNNKYKKREASSIYRTTHTLNIANDKFKTLQRTNKTCHKLKMVDDEPEKGR